MTEDQTKPNTEINEVPVTLHTESGASDESKAKKSSPPPTGLIIIFIIIMSTAGYFLYRQFSRSQTGSGKESVEETEIIQEPEDTFKTAVTGVNEIDLVLTYPNRDLTVATESITVSGVTEAAAEVSVNEKEITADSDGKFSVKLTLVEGENYVTVVAVNSEGKVAEVERIVTYEPDTAEE